ncbi:MAG: T9SS type A sorting domain-containing protein [Chitinophagaceae bacterium]|nr:T9SS type A sorting domain-containing protein [Chitinophagaceae bacterium]
MKKIYSLAIAFGTLFGVKNSIGQTAADYGVQVEAKVQTSPPKVLLNWKKTLGATSYNIQKKVKFGSAWTYVTSTTDTFYADVAVSADSTFEYRVSSVGGSANGAGSILAGIDAPATHNRGALILVVDTLFRDSCATEITQLMQDFNADGWSVIRLDYNRSTPDSIIKKAIKQYYTTTPNVASVLLLGHVAVPYSGELNPDGHSDHVGAWPADMFYGDMDGNWSDVSVNNITASRTANRNIPGDGKWDQSAAPSAIELQVGRIDFANMPLFAKSEVSMMRNYLYKAHKYKMDSLYVSRTGLVDDNFGAFSGEAFAANAWRNFPQLIGRQNIKAVDFMTTLNDSAYQWAYGTGSGSYTSASGIGTTTNFTTKKQKGIFTMLFGSYFGDWDSPNNFLRAPLCCSEPALTCFWAGRPNWYLHYMALGDNIGVSTKLTQNNFGGLYAPWGSGTTGVHIALMGDPSLRTDYIKPAQNITITSTPKKGAFIAWTASPDAEVIGYYIYRADSLYGNFSKISGLITATSFKDTIGTDGFYYYMVRPSKLITTPSGTYYNLGLGISDSATVSFPAIVSVNNISGKNYNTQCFPNPAQNYINIYTQLPDATKQLHLIITDINGKKLVEKTQQVYGSEITFGEDINHLAAGVYLIQLQTNSRNIATKQFVKK